MRVIVILITSFLISSYQFKEGGWEERDTPPEITDIQNSAINKLKYETSEDFGIKNSESEKNIRDLNSVQDLERESRNKQETEGQILIDALLDSSVPGVAKHFKDAEQLAKITKDMLGNLVSGLKQSHDINCREYAGNRELENSYHLYQTNYQETRTTDEPFFCEHLRNKYNCKDDLEIHCLKFSSRPEDVKINSANFPYKVTKEIMVMRNNYSPSSYQNKTEDTWFSGGAIDYKKYVTTYRLAETNLRMTFDVKLPPESFSEFSLFNVAYTGFLLITLNGHVVFSGPNGGSKLYSLGHNQEIKQKSSGFLFVYKREYFDSYPVIHNGNSSYCLGRDGNNKVKFVSTLDLRPYLKMHNNELVIKGYSANSGYIEAQMKSYERLCLRWSESKWNETCILQNN